jgi:hypothetical protein
MSSRKRRRTSVVWEHFENPVDGSVVCKICGLSISYYSSTTNLHDHLKRQHNKKCSKNQPSLPEIQKIPYNASHPRQVLISNQLYKVVINSLLPLSFLSNPALCQLLKTLDSHYRIPSPNIAKLQLQQHHQVDNDIITGIEYESQNFILDSPFFPFSSYL